MHNFITHRLTSAWSFYESFYTHIVLLSHRPAHSGRSLPPTRLFSHRPPHHQTLSSLYLVLSVAPSALPHIHHTHKHAPILTHTHTKVSPPLSSLPHMNTDTLAKTAAAACLMFDPPWMRAWKWDLVLCMGGWVCACVCACRGGGIKGITSVF